MVKETAKVSSEAKAGGVAAAVATVLVFVAQLLGLEVPPGVEGALAVIVGAAVAKVKA